MQYGTKLVINLNKIGNVMFQLSPTHKIYGQPQLVSITAILEYLCAEILELGGNVAMDNRKKRITVDHIISAIKHDDELDQLFDTSDALVSDDIPKFSVCAKKILALVHPDKSLTGYGCRFLDKLIHEFLKMVDYEVTLNPDQDIAQLLPGELAKHAQAECQKAMTAYREWIENVNQ